MRSTPLLDNLNDAVRENPVAAGLIGIGLAWVLLGKSGAGIRPAGLARTAKATIDNAVDAASGAVHKVREATASVSDTVAQGAEAVGSRVGDALGGLKSTANASEPKSEYARHFPLASSSRLSDLLDRQPLALAVVGVAVGAAIASALPSTDIEKRVVGPAGEKLKDTLADATSSIVDRAGEVVEEVSDEAVAQKLTPHHFKDAVKAGADKIKTVAEAGLDALGASVRGAAAIGRALRAGIKRTLDI